MLDSPQQADPAQPPEPDPGARTSYGHWRTVTLRFSDLDLNGHVNNVSYAVLFQEGRTSFLRDVRAAAEDPAIAFSVARLTIDFLREMDIPGAVDVGTAILAIGRASLTLGQAVFRDGVCVATSRAVMVRVTRGTPGSRPISADERRLLHIVAGTAQSPGATR